MGSLRLILVVLLIGQLTACARAEPVVDKRSLFDPQRHMRIDEVRPGMTGYGLSVFSGTTIERFDVEVISILRNFNPKHDVILIRVSGANLEHTGAISGMSGSPIFLKDDFGNHRMIGAFAYGWALAKDPLAGVQPIEYMLELVKEDPPPAQEPADSATVGAGPWSLWPMIQASYNPSGKPLESLLPPGRPSILSGESTQQLQPLATPLSTSGLSQRSIDLFGPLFARYGLVLLQTGGGQAPMDAPKAELAPGSVLAAPIVTGDVELTAIGTTTEVIGDHVVGFGHPFLQEGPIALPMGSGFINAIVPTYLISFKLGALSELRGTLINDQLPGIAGRIGEVPRGIPIEVRVAYEDGSFDQTYRYVCAPHRGFTPLLTGLLMYISVFNQNDLPPDHTLSYDVKMDFAGNRTLRMRNEMVEVHPFALFGQFVMPVLAASHNPFERVMLEGIKAEFRVAGEQRSAQVLSVNLPRTRYRPGETLRAFVTYRPFRGIERVMPIELELPRDLPDGDYRLSVGDQMTFLMEEQMTRPFRFTAENIDDVFAILQDVNEARHAALYLRLIRQTDGVALGRTALQHLPSSRRRVMLDSGRSNVAPFTSSLVKVVPTSRIMSGSAEFTIRIERATKVMNGHPPQPDSPSHPSSDPREKEPKPSVRGDGERNETEHR